MARKFQTLFLPAAVLIVTTGLLTACRNVSPSNSSGSGGDSNAVPMAFSIQNSINGFAVVQIDIIGYPTGTFYTLPVSIASGATTVFNFKIPADTYTVRIHDNDTEYDSWTPVSLGSGTNDSVIMNTGSATLNSVNCNPCGI